MAAQAHFFLVAMMRRYLSAVIIAIGFALIIIGLAGLGQVLAAWW
ncbi:MAG: hypothetical protein WA728_10625 [Xanthobacteraceae bacterium]